MNFPNLVELFQSCIVSVLRGYIKVRGPLILVLVSVLVSITAQWWGIEYQLLEFYSAIIKVETSSIEIVTETETGDLTRHLTMYRKVYYKC